MKAKIKVLLVAAMISLTLVGLMLVFNPHTPLPYDPSDKWGVVRNFVKIMMG